MHMYFRITVIVTFWGWVHLSACICRRIIVVCFCLRAFVGEPFLPVFVCLSVYEQDYPKRRTWIWMKCCMSTDVGTWTNWLTFEPDPDYSPDNGTRFLSMILYALQCRILSRWENLIYRYWAAATHGFTMVLRPTAAATRGFTMVLFTASRQNNFVRGTCALPSALLDLYNFILLYMAIGHTSDSRQLRFNILLFASEIQSPERNTW